MVCSILEELELLEVGVTTMTEKCLGGLEVNARISAEHANTTIALLTALAQRYSYTTITDLWKRSGGERGRFLQLLHDAGIE